MVITKNKLRARGWYCIYKGKEYKLTHCDAFSMLPNYQDFKYIISGHQKKIALKDSSQITSAYTLEIWGEVDGFVLQIMNFLDNKYCFLTSEKKIGEYYGLKYRHYDCCYDAIMKPDNEVTSIWEKRLPIDGFKYDTIKEVYLKKDDKWIL